MIKCKQFVKDISSDPENRMRNKWSYRMHMFLCVHCRNYVKQLDFISNQIKMKKVDDSKVSQIEKKVIEKIITRPDQE